MPKLKSFCLRHVQNAHDDREVKFEHKLNMGGGPAGVTVPVSTCQLWALTQDQLARLRSIHQQGLSLNTGAFRRMSAEQHPLSYQKILKITKIERLFTKSSKPKWSKTIIYTAKEYDGVGYIGPLMER